MLEEEAESPITMAASSISYVFFLFLLIASSAISSASAAAILDVKYKFAVRERPLTDLKAYDDHRVLRLLAGGVDLPLGGSGRPDNVGSVLLSITPCFLLFLVLNSETRVLRGFFCFVL